MPDISSYTWMENTEFGGFFNNTDWFVRFNIVDGRWACAYLDETTPHPDLTIVGDTPLEALQGVVGRFKIIAGGPTDTLVAIENLMLSSFDDDGYPSSNPGNANIIEV